MRYARAAPPRAAVGLPRTMTERRAGEGAPSGRRAQKMPSRRVREDREVRRGIEEEGDGDLHGRHRRSRAVLRY
jgi:hypothetical protein